MFKFLRSQAKVFYWVIAATFILFLFLGGMTGRGCRAPGTRQAEPGVVGYVNGQRIAAQQYDYAVRQQLNQMNQQAQGRELNANQVALAREQAWDALVQNTIFQQEIEARGLKATDDEVLAVFENSPPPELLAQYRTETGQIDMARYYSDLQNPDVDWSQAESYVRSLMSPSTWVSCSPTWRANSNQATRKSATITTLILRTIPPELAPTFSSSSSPSPPVKLTKKRSAPSCWTFVTKSLRTSRLSSPPPRATARTLQAPHGAGSSVVLIATGW